QTGAASDTAYDTSTSGSTADWADGSGTTQTGTATTTAYQSGPFTYSQSGNEVTGGYAMHRESAGPGTVYATATSHSDWRRGDGCQPQRLAPGGGAEGDRRRHVDQYAHPDSGLHARPERQRGHRGVPPAPGEQFGRDGVGAFDGVVARGRRRRVEGGRGRDGQ